MNSDKKPSYQELIQQIDALESEIHRIRNEGEQEIITQNYERLFDAGMKILLLFVTN